MPLRQVFRACLAVGLAAASFISPAMAAAPSVLWAFGGVSDDGFSPAAPLLVVSGVLYGTTTMGGVYGAGTVFALTPPVAGQTAWTETILHDFAGGGDGAEPIGGGLTLGASGVLYGGIPWTETVLSTFNSTDGGYPVAGLAYYKGKVYGTTASRSTFDGGEVFSLGP